MRKIQPTFRWFIKEYIFLIFVLLVSLAILVLIPDKELKKVVVVASSFFYFLFGLSHHYREKNLSLAIVLEYFCVALLIGIALFVLI